MRHHVLAGLLSIATILGGCGPVAAPFAGPGAEGPRTVALKRLTAAIFHSPPVVIAPGLGVTAGPGQDALYRLINAGFANRDDQEILRPQLAEQVPSIENGLWKLSPDGRMETTWSIKPNATWHDETAFTAEDILFAAQLQQDRELAVFLRPAVYNLIERIDAPDPRTVTIHWKSPFIYADQMFTFTRSMQNMPLAKHLLESDYRTNKDGFLDLPYWNEMFVGTGPFKVREFVRDSHVLLDAFDGYVLGRPKIDTIEVKFIPDTSTGLANVLAGAVDLTMGRGLAMDQGISVRDQGWKGSLATMAVNWYFIRPQFLNPNPPVIANVQFRRALLHAIDRQEMVDTIQYGQSQVTYSYVGPRAPFYREIEPSIGKYEYDPRKAADLVQSLGYSRGADGGLRDSAGQKLSVEIRTTPAENQSHRKVNLSVGDYWQRIGVGVDPLFYTTGPAFDAEWRATFPAFELRDGPNQLTRIGDELHSRNAATPERRFLGGNAGRHIDPTYDGLIDRMQVTVPMAERVRVIAEIMRHETENVALMPLIYSAEPILIGARIKNVNAGSEDNTGVAWNAHLWDLD